MLKRLAAASFFVVAFSGIAMSQQDAASCSAAGEAAFNAGDTAGAVTLLLPCAEAGDARAQFLLGVAYVNWGMTSEAIGWLQLAADQGDAIAADMIRYLQ